MAGVVLFGAAERWVQGMNGLFWQLSWDEWQVIAPMERLQPGSPEINVAEFLAALITCETLAPWCSGAFTLYCRWTTVPRNVGLMLQDVRCILLIAVRKEYTCFY